MVYFKIGNADFSGYVNGLTVKNQQKYNSQTNAAGNTVIDKINEKRTITVSFIPLDDTNARLILQAIKLQRNTYGYVTISYLEPEDRAIKTINTWVTDTQTSYYTIQSGKVGLKAFTINFVEL